MGETLERVLSLSKRTANLSKWKNFVSKTKNGKETVTLDMASRDYDFAGFSVKIVNVTPPKIHNREIKLSEYRVGLYLQRQRKF